MVRSTLVAVAVAVFLNAATGLVSVRNGNPAYLDATLSPEERASDLLQRMTWEEKVGQLGGVRYPFSRVNGKAYFNQTSYELIHETQNGQIGMYKPRYTHENLI